MIIKEGLKLIKSMIEIGVFDDYANEVIKLNKFDDVKELLKSFREKAYYYEYHYDMQRKRVYEIKHDLIVGICQFLYECSWMSYCFPLSKEEMIRDYKTNIPLLGIGLEKIISFNVGATKSIEKKVLDFILKLLELHFDDIKAGRTPTDVEFINIMKTYFYDDIITIIVGY
jgi:hypothetical protein